MNNRYRSVLLAGAAVLVWAGNVAPTKAATIFASTTGNALETPNFYSVAFLSGDPGARISSVTFTLPSGFFDFDGDTSFMNATVPILHLPTLSGLAPQDITFSFTGVQPTSLTVSFTPGSFGVGDSFQFGADVDELGSKLGGVFGAGATFSATLSSGLSGSAPFRTNTTVASSVTVTIVPEPSSVVLLVWGVVGLTIWKKRRMS